MLVIMHGLKDYSARYAALATRLAAAGYECQGDTCGFVAMLGLQLYGAD